VGRIQNGYEVKMRALLGRVRPRRLEEGIQNLLGKARRMQLERGLPEPRALEQVYNRLQNQLNRWMQVKELSQQSVAFRDALPGEPFFLCDAGLGGLTRWLRAAGYEADWIPDVDDGVLIAEAQQRGAILVTTDSMMMERRILREGIVPALWVPPAFKMHEQLALVLRELRLPLRPPRCMHCGGKLQVVEKETMRDRIPPKTYRWLDEFFVCEKCGKLFWHGTHWQRIREQLGSLTV
jgi:uncharacterized protein with PIN domain